MDEQKQYEDVCKGEFRSIQTKLDKMLGKLYVDNGGESFQSKINRHDIWMRRVTGVLVAIGLAVLGLCMKNVGDILGAIINH